MKLHANAALSLKGRRELCRRVVSEERTVSEAAEAAEVSASLSRSPDAISPEAATPWACLVRKGASSGRSRAAHAYALPVVSRAHPERSV